MPQRWADGTANSLFGGLTVSIMESLALVWLLFGISTWVKLLFQILKVMIKNNLKLKQRVKENLCQNPKWR